MAKSIEQGNKAGQNLTADNIFKHSANLPVGNLAVFQEQLKLELKQETQYFIDGLDKNRSFEDLKSIQTKIRGIVNQLNKYEKEKTSLD